LLLEDLALPDFSFLADAFPSVPRLIPFSTFAGPFHFFLFSQHHSFLPVLRFTPTRFDV